MLKEFQQFLLRGNVVDLAVGVVIGAAFNAVTSSFVSGLVTPFIAAIVKAPDFSNLFFTINGSKFLYGNFFNALISFILISAVVFFFVIKPINFLVSRSKKDIPSNPTTKKCPECLSEIPLEAKRCSHCTQPVQ